MLLLARSHAKADAAEPVALLATGEGILATWTGTAFDVYYMFNLVTLLVIAVLMYRSQVFSRPTAGVGIGGCSAHGRPIKTSGQSASSSRWASLVPWAVFALLVARRLLALVAAARSPDDAKGGHATLPQQAAGARR